MVVETEEKLQEMIGFGGAFTDAATINFFKLPEDVQEKVRTEEGGLHSCRCPELRRSGRVKRPTDVALQMGLLSLRRYGGIESMSTGPHGK